MPQPKKPNLQSDPVVDALASDPTQAAGRHHGPQRLSRQEPDGGHLEAVPRPGADGVRRDRGVRHQALRDAAGRERHERLGRSSAPLRHVRTQTQDVQAEFLGGSITDELLATAPGSPGLPAGADPHPAAVDRGPVPQPDPVPLGPMPVDARRHASAGSRAPRRPARASAATPCPTLPACPTQAQAARRSRGRACRSRSGATAPSTRVRHASARASATPSICPTTSPAVCPTLGIACIPTRFAQCPSEGCPTEINTGCGPIPSAAFICPSTNVCPSNVGCPSEGFCDPTGGFDPGGTARRRRDRLGPRHVALAGADPGRGRGRGR